MAKNVNSAAKAPKKRDPIKGFVHAIKEMCRKFIVSLKRRPHNIAFAAFIIAFLVYSLNLTSFSNTTAKLLLTGMGLAEFAIMLLSMLSLVCFMNAFPYRKKVNIPMLVLMLVMVAIIIGCDVFYINAVNSVQSDPSTAIAVTQETAYLVYAPYYLQVHIIILCVGVALTALLPVYKKLLRKINTNIEVEGNAEMGAIDLSATE